MEVIQTQKVIEKPKTNIITTTKPRKITFQFFPVSLPESINGQCGKIIALNVIRKNCFLGEKI